MLSFKCFILYQLENSDHMKPDMLILLEDDLDNKIFPSQRLTLVIFLGFVTCCCVITNSSALIILPRRSYQTLYKGCLISLSLSDLLLGVFIGVDNITRVSSPDVRWILGADMCKLMPLLTTVFILASSLTLTFIAIDRFQGLICLHEKFKPGCFGTTNVILLLWTISFGSAFPMYQYYDIQVHCIFLLIPSATPIISCSDCAFLCNPSEDLKVYFPIMYSLIFIPLLSLFCICYFMLARHVWRSRARTGKPQIASTTTETGTSSTIVMKIAPPTTIRSDYTKRKLRTFKVILIVLFTFILCRLPQWSFILFTLLHSTDTNEAHVIKAVFSILTIANTAVNPLLYLFLDNVIHVKILVSQKIGLFWQYLRKMCSCQSAVYQVKE